MDPSQDLPEKDKRYMEELFKKYFNINLSNDDEQGKPNNEKACSSSGTLETDFQRKLILEQYFSEFLKKHKKRDECIEADSTSQDKCEPKSKEDSEKILEISKNEKIQEQNLPSCLGSVFTTEDEEVNQLVSQNDEMLKINEMDALELVEDKEQKVCDEVLITETIIKDTAVDLIHFCDESNSICEEAGGRTPCSTDLEGNENHDSGDKFHSQSWKLKPLVLVRFSDSLFGSKQHTKTGDTFDKDDNQLATDDIDGNLGKQTQSNLFSGKFMQIAVKSEEEQTRPNSSLHSPNIDSEKCTVSLEEFTTKVEDAKVNSHSKHIELESKTKKCRCIDPKCELNLRGPSEKFFCEEGNDCCSDSAENKLQVFKENYEKSTQKSEDFMEEVILVQENVETISVNSSIASSLQSFDEDDFEHLIKVVAELKEKICEKGDYLQTDDFERLRILFSEAKLDFKEKMKKYESNNLKNRKHLSTKELKNSRWQEDNEPSIEGSINAGKTSLGEGEVDSSSPKEDNEIKCNDKIHQTNVETVHNELQEVLNNIQSWDDLKAFQQSQDVAGETSGVFQGKDLKHDEKYEGKKSHRSVCSKSSNVRYKNEQSTSSRTSEGVSHAAEVVSSRSERTSRSIVSTNASSLNKEVEMDLESYIQRNKSKYTAKRASDYKFKWETKPRVGHKHEFSSSGQRKQINIDRYKPMKDPNSEFYIEIAIATMYEEGLRDKKWNPTQCVYELSSQFEWSRPEFLQLHYSYSEGFLFCVKVNDRQFKGKEHSRTKKLAKKFAAITFLNYLGFDFPFEDPELPTASIKSMSMVPSRRRHRERDTSVESNRSTRDLSPVKSHRYSPVSSYRSESMVFPTKSRNLDKSSLESSSQARNISTHLCDLRRKLDQSGALRYQGSGEYSMRYKEQGIVLPRLQMDQVQNQTVRSKRTSMRVRKRSYRSPSQSPSFSVSGDEESLCSAKRSRKSHHCSCHQSCSAPIASSMVMEETISSPPHRYQPNNCVREESLLEPRKQSRRF